MSRGDVQTRALHDVDGIVDANAESNRQCHEVGSESETPSRHDGPHEREHGERCDEPRALHLQARQRGENSPKKNGNLSQRAVLVFG